MKKMELTQMENLQGGVTPKGGQIYCAVISTIWGFICPPVAIATTIACLFVD